MIYLNKLLLRLKKTGMTHMMMKYIRKLREVLKNHKLVAHNLLKIISKECHLHHHLHLK
jgi:hypothetical protein